MIKAFQETKVPVTSVDAPSSWDMENGPPKSGLGSAFMPTALVSLTAPKPLVKYFTGRHFIGGRYAPRLSRFGTGATADGSDRFVSPSIANKYDFGIPEYTGIDQVVEVTPTGQKL